MSRTEIIEAAVKKANLQPRAAAAVRRVAPRVYDPEWFAAVERAEWPPEQQIESLAKDFRETVAELRRT